MIPKDIKKMIHDIRLVGNYDEKYNSTDDETVLRNSLEGLPVQIPTSQQGDWSTVKQALKEKKSQLLLRSEEYFREGSW